MDAIDGRPASIYLAGQTATGKTTRLEALVAQALASGYVVWTSSGSGKISPLIRGMATRVDDLETLVHDALATTDTVLIAADDANYDGALRDPRLRTDLIAASTRENIDVVVTMRRDPVSPWPDKGRLVSGPITALRAPALNLVAS